jgi:anthranilate synthase/aminodeoxychorismate synthase-like glutamine amidotransferase
VTVLVIDNYDSFTWNLVQEMGELGADLEVVRNDEVSVADVLAMAPAGVVISPGPGRPEDAGISCDLVRALGATTPLLGVCLGHQAIGVAFGASVGSAPSIMHGKTSEIRHDGEGVFANVESPIVATRYHSLVVLADTIPAELVVTAWTDGVVMGVRHREWPMAGVQFHPESVLTTAGPRLLANFLRRTGLAVTDRSSTSSSSPPAGSS